MTVHLKTLPATLPCVPCRHEAVCCSWGTFLTESERSAIEAAHPGTTRWTTEQAPEGEYRTNVNNGRCVFLADALCALHGERYYPTVCKGFPWTNKTSDDPYPGALTICPELT